MSHLPSRLSPSTFGLFLVLGLTAAATAKLAPDPLISATAVQSADTLRAARSLLAQKIDTVNSAETKDPAAPDQRTAAIAQLRSIDVLYARFQTVLEERRQLK